MGSRWYYVVVKIRRWMEQCSPRHHPSSAVSGRRHVRVPHIRDQNMVPYLFNFDFTHDVKRQKTADPPPRSGHGFYYAGVGLESESSKSLLPGYENRSCPKIAAALTSPAWADHPERKLSILKATKQQTLSFLRNYFSTGPFGRMWGGGLRSGVLLYPKSHTAPCVLSLRCLFVRVVVV